jgi:hypothetical protein
VELAKPAKALWPTAVDWVAVAAAKVPIALELSPLATAPVPRADE